MSVQVTAMAVPLYQIDIKLNLIVFIEISGRPGSLKPQPLFQEVIK
jgi:hypothetical protein